MIINTIFVGCVLNLLILIPSEIFFNSAWNFCNMSLGLLDENGTSVSAVEKLAFENFKQDSKSVRYRMNSNGTRQDPCGIPHETCSKLDLCPFKEQGKVKIFCLYSHTSRLEHLKY